MAKANANTSPTSGAQFTPIVPVRDTVHFPGVIQTILIGRELSISALQHALKQTREVIVTGQIDQKTESPVLQDLYRVGTLSEVLHVLPLPDGTMRVVLRGMARALLGEESPQKDFLCSTFQIIEEKKSSGIKSKAQTREVIQSLEYAINLGLQIPSEVVDNLHLMDEPGQLADTISHHLPISSRIKQDLLEETETQKRLFQVNVLLKQELQILELQGAIQSKVEKELGQTQREYYLREQLKAIHEELTGDTILSDEGEEYKKKLYATNMPPENLERAIQEVMRLERAPTSSPENMVIRNYLDWLIEIPWDILSEDQIDVKLASKTLDKHHHGLETVKNRILDFLAVRQLSKSLKGPILCFVGPPGVGKTSIGKSIAEALGRKFHRISLGGIRDEAEIRGHRRTYIGSMPGRLIQGLKSTKTRNPVFMLDEIDKMTSDLRGDPTSALLEALDPEQNHNFSDHYIELPVDLSAVLFIATANTIEDIPAPLRDRMEVIQFPSYTEEEKLAIAQKYLLPKMIKAHGLKTNQLKIEKPALKTVIRNYTRESGIRNLEREIATICRKSARKVTEAPQSLATVTTDNLNEYLGRSKYSYGSKTTKPEIGTATGLVYSSYGGDIIAIEAYLSPPYGDTPNIQLTGSLGDVMKESALTAISYLKSNQKNLSATQEFKSDVHIHVPAGAIPKDGPSAGITLFTALASAFSGRAVRTDLAMTGEITLRGKVLPVGGVREKVLAAHRAGIKNIILPTDNEYDLDEIPANVLKTLKIHFVKHVDEVLELALLPLG